jgi:hypothetical protein
MVRMNPLNEADGEANTARSSSSEDTKSSFGSHKRTRSSLDYKGDPSSDKIIPQDIQSKLFEAGATTGGSRSKGQAESDEYNPFAGMSSEEVLRHLYENPELAKSLGIDPAAAGAAAGITKKSYRTQLLQKQGFPFMQWAIVLLVCAFAFYRLYKFAKPQPASVKQKVKRKAGKKALERAPLKDDYVLSKVVAEIEGAGDDTKEASGKGQQKKAKKKPAKKVKAKPALTPKSKEYSDSDSDAAPAPRLTKSKQKKVKLVAEPAVNTLDDDSRDWQVVGAKAAPTPVSLTNGGSALKPPSAEESVKLPNGSGPTPVAETQTGDSQSGKKKKKPKKKADSGTASSSAITDATTAASSPTGGEDNDAVDDDEALALRLQAEENSLAPNAAQDDVWAEVSTKKKKSKVIEHS